MRTFLLLLVFAFSTGRLLSADEPGFQQSFPTPQVPTPPRFDQVIPTPTPFDHPAKPLPNSGIFWTLPGIPRIAPFKITTQSGSRHFVKLVDALVYAWTNEPDLAFGELRVATQTPGGVSYGQLKADYAFDPLRKDPRFEEFLAQMRPAASRT